MSLSDAHLSSVSDIMRALDWKLHYEQQRADADARQAWEQTRLLAAYSISPYSKKKLSKMSDLFKFQWEVDEERPGEKMTLEQRTALLAKLDKTIDQNGERH